MCDIGKKCAIALGMWHVYIVEIEGCLWSEYKCGWMGLAERIAKDFLITLS